MTTPERSPAVARPGSAGLHLDGGAWVLVRASGTEPVARLYVEAPDDETLAAVRDAATRHFFA
jgi:phosphomannomutase